MNVMAADTPLRQIRESIGASREDLVRKAPRISLATVRNAEKGKGVRYDTALRLLEAVNILLQEAGKDSVKLEDLGLNLY